MAYPLERAVPSRRHGTVLAGTGALGRHRLAVDDGNDGDSDHNHYDDF